MQKRFVFLIVILVLGLGWFGYTKLKPKSAVPTYQTSDVTKGNLVVDVTGSGSVTAVNNVIVDTQATGVVTKIYVKDGDTVKAGQKLADLELDESGRQSYLSALASYQSAKNNVAGAEASANSANSSMWVAHEKFMSDAVSRNLAAEDPTFIEQSSDWLAAEAKYKNQLEAITQAKTALASASLSYRTHSPSIYAPISGRISGFSLQEGTVVGATTSSSGSSLATKIASVVTSAKPTITISLTEVDITKVSPGDKASITVDSQPGKTFTGSVVSVDTVGSVSSGVTSYPVALRLDTDEPGLYPNMSSTATIITKVQNDALIVPISAVTVNGDTSTVQIMENGQPKTIPVTTGLESDSEVEIVSGLSEGQTVVTTTINPTTTSTGTAQQSVFSSIGRSGGGNARFVGR